MKSNWCLNHSQNKYFWKIKYIAKSYRFEGVQISLKYKSFLPFYTLLCEIPKMLIHAKMCIYWNSRKLSAGWKQKCIFSARRAECMMYQDVITKYGNVNSLFRNNNIITFKTRLGKVSIGDSPHYKHDFFFSKYVLKLVHVLNYQYQYKMCKVLTRYLLLCI